MPEVKRTDPVKACISFWMITSSILFGSPRTSTLICSGNSHMSCPRTSLHTLTSRKPSRYTTITASIGWAHICIRDRCFDGEPEGGAVAASSVGVANSKEKKGLFMAGYNEMLVRLRPETILFYGNVPEECCGNIIQIQPFHKRFERKV